MEEYGAVYEASLVNRTLEKMCWPTGRNWVDSGWAGNFYILAVENISVSSVEG